MKKEYISVVLIVLVLIAAFIAASNFDYIKNALSGRAVTEPRFSSNSYINIEKFSGSDLSLDCSGKISGYWNFEKGLVDASLHQLRGEGNGIDYVEGKVGEAAKFSGNTKSYVMLPNEVLDGKEHFSISFWMKSAGSKDGIFSVSDGINHNELTLYDQRRLTLYYHGFDISLNAKVSDNKWHHLIFNINTQNKYLEFYMDGRLKKKVELKSDKPIKSRAIVLGQEQDRLRGGFEVHQAYSGLIDEFTIYNKFLSERDAKYLYNGGKGSLICQNLFKDFIVSIDSRRLAEKNINPRLVIDRLEDLGATGVAYRCRFLRDEKDKKYFERFAKYLNKTRRLDLYYELKDSCIEGKYSEDAVYYKNLKEIQGLVDKYTIIQGIFVDDYDPEKDEFCFLSKLKFDKNIYGIVYSQKGLVGLNYGCDRTRKLDGFVDYIDARFGDANSYCNGKSSCNIKNKDYEEKISYSKNYYGNDAISFAGFHIWTPKHVITTDEQLKKFLDDAKKANPDGYVFWLLDFGEGYEDWNRIDDYQHLTSKYEIVKRFIKSFR